MRLLHIMIRVKNYEESMKFYGELLGLKEVKTMDLDDSRLHYLADSYGNVQIELTENFDTPLDGYKNGDAFGHFAFETESFEEFTQKPEPQSTLTPPASGESSFKTSGSEPLKRVSMSFRLTKSSKCMSSLSETVTILLFSTGFTESTTILIESSSRFDTFPEIITFFSASRNELYSVSVLWNATNSTF